MARRVSVFRAAGGNRRRWRSIRVWAAAGVIIAIPVMVWAARAYQVWPLLFPPAAATADYQLAGGAADWPAIRRDAGGSGRASGAAPQPPFTTLWEVDVPGTMLATPAVVGDRVFITTDAGTVAALDAATGGTVWSYDAGAPSDSAPAIAGNAIYLGTRDHRALALDRSSGRLIWERNLGNIVLGSPIVVGGTVYIGSTNGRLEALDAATGERRWSAPANGWVVGHPASDGKVVAATSQGERFITVDPDSGRRRLVFFTGTPAVGGPVIADGRAYFVTNRGAVWAVDPGAASRPFSRLAYVAKFNFFAWRLRAEPPRQKGSIWVGSARGRVKHSLVYAGGKALAVNEAGRVSALDGASGAELWHNELGAEPAGEPVAAGGILLIGVNDRRLVGLDIASGATAWEYGLGGRNLAAAPAAAGGVLYVPTSDGRLAALRGEGR